MTSNFVIELITSVLYHLRNIIFFFAFLLYNQKYKKINFDIGCFIGDTKNCNLFYKNFLF